MTKTAVETFPISEERKQDSFMDGKDALNSLEAPKLISLTEMLTQGLTSHDNELIEKALSITNADLMKNAIKNLPEGQVVSLFDALIVRIEKRPMRTMILVPWLKNLLLFRSTHLMSIPNFSEKIRPLRTIIETRTKTHKRLIQLRSKLDFVLEQVGEQRREKQMIDPVLAQKLATTPMAIYDESENEEEEEEDDEEEQDGSDIETNEYETDNDSVSDENASEYDSEEQDSNESMDE